MIVALLIWTYLSFVCFAAGHFFLRLIRQATGDNSSCHFSIIAVLGLVGITILGSIVSLFFRLNWEINLLLLLFACGYYFINRRALVLELQQHWQRLPGVNLLTWLVVLVSLLIALVFAATPTLNFDFGLYHMTTIKWISSYPAVPGLGNIHGRLAFNSSWYILSALFSFSFLKSFAFYDVSPYFYLLVSIYGAHGVQQVLDGKRDVVEITKAFFVLPVAVLLGFLDAPATDLATNYLIWLTGVFFLVKMERKTMATFDVYTVLIFLLSAFVCTVKLSSIVILLLPGYLLIREWKSMKWQGASLMILLMVLIFVPWVARNVILSGYLIYPFDKIDIFAVDWKMPIEEVRLESAIVKQYGKYPNLPITQDAVEYSLKQAGAPFMSWFPDWFNYRSWLLKLILLMLPIGFFSLLFGCAIDWIRNGFKKLRFDSHYILIFGLMLFGTAFCFYLGPSLRYSYGFILFFNILFFSVVFYIVSNSTRWGFTRLLLTVAVVMSLSLPFIRTAKTFVKTVVAGNYVVFPHVATHGELESFTYNGFKIYKPKEGYHCWDAPLPCTALPPSGKVHMRSNEIEDGYRFVGEY